MCESAEKHPRFEEAGQAAARASSRRRRLWELPVNCHCPVLGVGLPMATLRKLVGKLFCERDAGDYAVHVAAVQECQSRNTLSELLQAALERRHALHVKRARLARSREAVFGFWKQAVADGGAAGAFWAALTHPQCDAQLEELLCRDMHMLQHQAGAGERVDQAAYLALQQEHLVMLRQLGKAQARVTQIVAERAGEQQALEARLMQARAQLLGRDAMIASLQAKLAALHVADSTLEARGRLKQHIGELGERLRQRDGELGTMQARLAAAQRRIDQLACEHAQLQRAAQVGTAPAAQPAPLVDKTVLCVGGRNGNLAHYRGAVEQEGGHFAHHDGGLEESADLLDAGLAAADLVICQTGCISHNAYWRVKEYCKRTGKRCVFIDNPSSASFSRGLRQIAIRDLTAVPER